jgi:hypothetical protein
MHSGGFLIRTFSALPGILVGISVGHEVSKNKIVKNLGSGLWVVGLHDDGNNETVLTFMYKSLMCFLIMVVDYSSCRYALSVLDRRSSI